MRPVDYGGRDAYFRDEVLKSIRALALLCWDAVPKNAVRTLEPHRRALERGRGLLSTASINLQPQESHIKGSLEGDPPDSAMPSKDPSRRQYLTSTLRGPRPKPATQP